MSKEAMKLALEALNFEDSGDPECEHGFMYDECPNDKCDKRRFKEAIKALEEALAKQEQRNVSEQLGEPEYRCCPHDHDCAVHNMPAYPAGPCDCTYKDTFNTPSSADVHEVCLKLIERELDRLTDENFGRTPNDKWANKLVDVYQFFDSNPKAKKLTVIYTTPQQRKPLTNEQIMALLVELCVPTKYEGVTETFTAVVRAIEAAHGIKE